MHPRLLRSAAAFLILAPSFAASETGREQAEKEGLLLDSMLITGQVNTDALKKRFANSIDNECNAKRYKTYELRIDLAFGNHHTHDGDGFKSWHSVCCRIWV